MTKHSIICCPPEEVNPAFVNEFLREFYVIDSLEENAGDINVVITSDGGWSQGGMAIFDALMNANNKVVTTGLGAVSSIAVLIFQAGTERWIGPSASLFLHEMSLHGEGPVTHMRRSVAECERLHVYNKALSSRSGGILTPADIQKMCVDETLLTPEEAIERGLADRILGQPKKKDKKK